MKMTHPLYGGLERNSLHVSKFIVSKFVAKFANVIQVPDLMTLFCIRPICQHNFGHIGR